MARKTVPLEYPEREGEARQLLPKPQREVLGIGWRQCLSNCAGCGKQELCPAVKGVASDSGDRIGWRRAWVSEWALG